MRIGASPKFLLSRNVIITACEVILKSNPPGCQAAALASKRFFEWTQIHLLRPCRAPLPMNIPIGVSDRVDAEQAGLAAFRGQVGHSAEQPITLDPTIDDNVRDVNPERPVLMLSSGAKKRQGRAALSPGISSLLEAL
jgi:hypothetical protein